MPLFYFILFIFIFVGMYCMFTVFYDILLEYSACMRACGWAYVRANVCMYVCFGIKDRHICTRAERTVSNI